MSRASWLALAAAVLVVAGVMAAGCDDAANTAARTPVAGSPRGAYISLGDSIAAGNGSSDPAKTSFVALLAHDEGGLPLTQLAKAGATTDDVIQQQMRAALDLIGRGNVALITISVGGNDLAPLIPNAACLREPLPPSCPLDTALAGVERNLDIIVTRLRAADATVPIVLLAYPNFFSGTGHAFEAPAGRVLPLLDDIVRRVASRYPHTAVADAAPAFEGKGKTLTHVLDPQFDPHPTDAGHRLIAEAFEAAIRTERASSSGTPTSR
jgi:lysophospholipase L1-like esterase